MIRTFPRQPADDGSFTISPTPFVCSALSSQGKPWRCGLLICSALLRERRRAGFGSATSPIVPAAMVRQSHAAHRKKQTEEWTDIAQEIGQDTGQEIGQEVGQDGGEEIVEVDGAPAGSYRPLLLADAERLEDFDHAGGVRLAVCRASDRHLEGGPIQTGVFGDLAE